MIYLASNFINYPVFSISALGVIGQIEGIIIDPYRFSVSGFWVSLANKTSNSEKILVTTSIRQISVDKILINDVSDIHNIEDLPKLKKIIQFDYQIPGKRVIATNKQYLGSASDFSFNSEDFKITAIMAIPPIYQRLRIDSRHFNRSQIEKISPSEIKVNTNPKTEKILNTSNVSA